MMILTASRRLLIVLLVWVPTTLALSLSTVAVIGTTGQLGREAVQQLSKAGIETRCLLRHDISGVSAPASLQEATNSAEIAAYLSKLPGVEMVQGDVGDIASLRTLLKGCDACLALYGSVPPKPFFRALFPFWFPESDPKHPKQVNYNGVKNLITVLQETPTIRLVRITGKGEDPWSIFSILINAFSGIAKGWNYEAEQLLRKSSVDYTIIRPGVMKDSVEDGSATLGFKDNGGDLPVTAVSYAQIANFAIESAKADNCKKATITAMNVEADADFQTIDQIKPDTREFPETLLDKHKQAARVGGLAFIAFSFLVANAVASIMFRLFGFK